MEGEKKKKQIENYDRDLVWITEHRAHKEPREQLGYRREVGR
jgi:hypothetical protein